MKWQFNGCTLFSSYETYTKFCPHGAGCSKRLIRTIWIWKPHFLLTNFYDLIESDSRNPARLFLNNWPSGN